MDDAIFISHLNKTYNTLKAVDDLAFHVKKTECYGLLGPNGAGKSTVMKMIYGKSECDRTPETVIDIFGFNPLGDALAIKSFSGIVPQDDNLDSELNVFNNLYIYSKFYGMSRRDAKQRIDELLMFMELKEKARSSIRELSGGMKRRLTIARALLNKPKLLILDEPTTGLDPQVRRLIWDKLRELKEMGVTILLSTHYMEEAFQICDRILIMDHGKKIMEGRPRELLSANLDKFVMEVYGCGGDSESAPNGGKCAGVLEQSGYRYERHEDALYVFGDNIEGLTELGENLGKILGVNDFYIRHSNLEDLFLKVTGRSLNEQQ